MEETFQDKRLRFLIGDIRDKDRLSRALDNVNIVIHAAALKQVPVAEYNPFEAVKTNTYGAQNLIESCLDNDVEQAIAISTDKAVSPFNTYGATKLLMEKLFITANYYKGSHKTNFLCVRYGNVLGSRGSIVPKIIEQITKKQKITITDPNMTRFNITMDEALNLVLRAIKNGSGGEIFVPKLKAYKLEDIKNALLELLNASNKTETISVRPGEKYHESLINKHEIRNTFDNKEDYVIIDKDNPLLYYEDSPKLVKSNFEDEYSSDKVPLLTKEEIKKILINEKLLNL